MMLTKANELIYELQDMASQLADCDPDGDRTLEEGLEAFLISAYVGMLDEADLDEMDWKVAMQFILDNTVLDSYVPYDAEQMQEILSERNSDAFDTLYGMANGWDLDGIIVSWPIYAMLALFFGRDDISERFTPTVAYFLKLISVALDAVAPRLDIGSAFDRYMATTLWHTNEFVRQQCGVDEMYDAEEIINQETNDDYLEMAETLDDWIMFNGGNPFDLETRMNAIEDPFGLKH